MAAMQGLSDAPLTATLDGVTMPRFQDGTTDMQELLRQLAESVVNEIMDAEADQMCGEGNGRNGYRERKLVTCVGTLTPGVPKLRVGSFFPDDVLTRYQRVDRALVAAVAETCAAETSTRKVQRVARKMGIDRLSKDQVSAIARDLDADVEELLSRGLSVTRVPYLWLDATYVKCRREGRVASTAVVTAIGGDEHGGGTSWASPPLTRSPTTPGGGSSRPSGAAASPAWRSSPPTPTRGSDGPSGRSSRARPGSAASSTSCATAHGRPGAGVSAGACTG